MKGQLNLHEQLCLFGMKLSQWYQVSSAIAQAKVLIATLHVALISGFQPPLLLE